MKTDLEKDLDRNFHQVASFHFPASLSTRFWFVAFFGGGRLATLFGLWRIFVVRRVRVCCCESALSCDCGYVSVMQ